MKLVKILKFMCGFIACCTLGWGQTTVLGKGVGVCEIDTPTSMTCVGAEDKVVTCWIIPPEGMVYGLYGACPDHNPLPLAPEPEIETYQPLLVKAQWKHSATNSVFTIPYNIPYCPENVIVKITGDDGNIWCLLLELPLPIVTRHPVLPLIEPLLCTYKCGYIQLPYFPPCTITPSCTGTGCSLILTPAQNYTQNSIQIFGGDPSAFTLWGPTQKTISGDMDVHDPFHPVK
jgi:hypothetical protein